MESTGVAIDDSFIQRDHVIGAALRVGLRLQAIDAIVENFARRHIQAEIHVFSRTITRLFNGLHENFERLFVGLQVRGKAAFITHRRAVAAAAQHGFKAVEDLGADAQRLGETGHAVPAGS